MLPTMFLISRTSPPGVETPFDITFAHANDSEIAKYEVYVEGAVSK